MPQLNNQRSPKSRCTFCGSLDYGKGCRYGPHGVHMHTDNSTKCSFCGSTDYGKGCRLNPLNNLHIRGAVYNNMYKETIQSYLDNKLFIRELKKPYKEFECFKLKIIDEKGNKLKNPSTIQEQQSYTPFIKTVLKLKKYLGPKVELLEVTEQINCANFQINENVQHYKLMLEYQQKANDIVNELYKLVDEAQQDGIALDELKKIINA